MAKNTATSKSSIPAYNAYLLGFHIEMKKKGKTTTCKCQRGKHTKYVNSTAADPLKTCKKQLLEYCKENGLSTDEKEIAKEDTTPVKQTVYEKVTDRIIKRLEEGCIPWRNPVIEMKPSFNIETDKPYNLVNQLLLSGGPYGSFKQWTALGGHIMKGAKAERIITWAKIKAKKQPEGEEEKYFLRPREMCVFGIDQVEFPHGRPEEIDHSINMLHLEYENEPIKIAEVVADEYKERTGVKEITSGGNVNYYDPEKDAIGIVPMDRFEDIGEYYSAKFHEIGHSTGTKERLDRKEMQEGLFGDEQYSKEELVAEMSSAYIMNLLGIETRDSFENSVSYIDGWKKVLADEPNLFVSAAIKAQKAVDFILGGKTLDDFDTLVTVADAEDLPF